MKLLRTLVGIVGIPLAVFAGGCGLLFFASGVTELSAGRNDYGMTVIGPLVGGVPALIGGLVGWWAFRKPRSDTPPGNGDKPA
jgi:uncharacterized membrane protein